MVMTADKYFATEPTKECGLDIYAKACAFYTCVDTAGYFDMIRKSYMHYYGNSGAYNSTGRVFQSGKINRNGEQGELYDFKINSFRNLIQHLLTMTTAEKPAVEAMAANTDLESQAQAELGTGLLEYYMVEKRLERFLVEAVEKSIVFGSGSIGVYWNPGIGQKYVASGVNTTYAGDLEFKVYSPLDIVIDPWVNKRRGNWCIVRDYVNKWDLVAQYPELKNDILAVQSKDTELNKYYFVTPTSGFQSDEVATLTLYHEKTVAVPEGRMTTILPGGVVLFDGPLPYKKVPVYSIMPSRVEGTPFGYTVAFDMLSIQEGRDIVNSAILTNIATFGVSNVWLPKNHDVRVQALGAGLRVIETDPKMGKPEVLNLTRVPSELFNYSSSLDSEMEKMSGLNSIVRGQPSGQLSGASGAAMALLASQSIQFNYSLQREYEFLFEDVATAALQTLQLYAKTERIALIAGKSKAPYVKYFSSKDIEKLDRAVVKRTSAISRTTAGKVDIGKTLIDAGMISTPEEYLSVIKTGNLDPLVQNDRAQLMLITKENENLREGKPVIALATDKHNLHIREHSAVLADPDIRAQPILVENTLAHIQEHIDLLSTTKPELLAILGEQSLMMSPTGQMEDTGNVGEPFETQDQVLEGEMPNLPNMPTNPLSGEEFQSPVEEANNPGGLI